ncbi:PTS transporter subunit EIIC [Spiroplasma endosymbiont of Aspidapion aeneum]|uniref:PTS transporter subunit EIIC n=1 Tax=Spiroplasma endosymbiont of Aspidapion aeneum TaxID=3066276 RepID=UPI00313ABE57
MIKKESKKKTKLTAKDWINNKMMPAMTKFASQRHLTAIRDAFGILTPIIIGGSISFLLGIILFGAGDTLETSLLGLLAKATGKVDDSSGTWVVTGGWSTANKVGEKIFSTIFNFTLGTFSLMIALMLAYIYAEKINLKNPMFVGVFNLVLFMITAATFKSDSSKFNYFYDSKGMLAAIIQTFLVVELYKVFATNNRLLIKMPKQVPPMVATGFSLLFPVAIVFIIVSSFNTGCWAIGNYTNWNINDNNNKPVLLGGEYGFVGLFYKLVSAPFSVLISGNNVGLGFGVLYQFLIGFFWFFGLNGSSVVNGAFYPFLMQMFVQNADAVSKFGYNISNAKGMLDVVNIQFLESYAQTTGWGHTGALLLAISIYGKVKEHKEVAKIAAVPGIFSINEPVTFGIPVMLHPIYGIAAMFAMPITTFVAWLFVGPFGMVHKSYILVPWTLPPGVGALLSSGLDWKAFVLSWFCLVIAFVWYIPFVLIANKYHFNLNVKTYMDKGMTRDSALAHVKNDVLEYKEMVVERKRLKKIKTLEIKKQKEEFKKLDPEIRKEKLHLIKLTKQEQKSLEKLQSVNYKSSKLNNIKLQVDVVEYGGYKIRINGKTVATAMSKDSMTNIVEKICNTNKIEEYNIVDNGNIIENIKVTK